VVLREWWHYQVQRLMHSSAVVVTAELVAILPSELVALV
jgi:hypothetical protein